MSSDVSSSTNLLQVVIDDRKFAQKYDATEIKLQVAFSENGILPIQTDYHRFSQAKELEIGGPSPLVMEMLYNPKIEPG